MPWNIESLSLTMLSTMFQATWLSWIYETWALHMLWANLQAIWLPWANFPALWLSCKHEACAKLFFHAVACACPYSWPCSGSCKVSCPCPWSCSCHAIDPKISSLPTTDWKCILKSKLLWLIHWRPTAACAFCHGRKSCKAEKVGVP